MIYASYALQPLDRQQPAPRRQRRVRPSDNVTNLIKSDIWVKHFFASPPPIPPGSKCPFRHPEKGPQHSADQGGQNCGDESSQLCDELRRSQKPIDIKHRFFSKKRVSQTQTPKIRANQGSENRNSVKKCLRSFCKACP